MLTIPIPQVVKRFDGILRKVRASSARYQQTLIEKRKLPSQRSGKHPQFVEGELVVIVPEKPLHTESLLAGKKGPFIVVKQYRNDVTLRHINGSCLKIFLGLFGKILLLSCCIKWV